MKKFCLLFFLIFVSSWQLFCQDLKIHGKVVDATTKEPLIGVNVIVKGTSNGVTTDAQGDYTLTLKNSKPVLQFSFIGYLTEEFVYKGESTVDVALSPDVKKLDEIVVIGYGAVKKSDATGSVATVSSKDFNRGAITSPENLIAGKSAGVVITSNSGAPGVSSTIRIRGGSSMSASNDPLIVIDGVPLDQNVGGTASPLASINPNDIESFTVLKDASATAIYGSRASNGVIIITTKRGGKKLSVSYTVNTSIHSVPKYVDVLSADDFRQLIQQRFPGLKGNDSLAKSYLGTANTNWQKEIYRTSFGQDHNLSIGGTANKMPYRISLGYTNDNGVLKTTGFKRTTGAISLDPSLLNNHLKINANVKFSNEKNDFGDQSAIADAVLFNPTYPVFSTEAKRWRGYTTWTSDNKANGIEGRNLGLPGVANPMAKLELTDNSSTVFRSIGSFQADYNFDFLPEMHAVLNLAYDYSKTEGKNNVKDSTQWIYLPYSGCGKLENYRETRKNELLTFNLNYTKELDAIASKVSLMAGYEWSHFWRENIDSAMNVGQTDYINPVTRPRTEYYIVSFFGRLNYSLLKKYLLTFTLRDDGTSRFSNLNRWGLFPSTALAWKLKDESWFENMKSLSDLKLRLGYGITGQQQVSSNDYPYIPTYRTSYPAAQYPLGIGNFIPMLRPNGYDENLRWESTTTYNAGLDFGFFNNRLTGTIDYYNRKTKDLINSINVAVGTNFTQPLMTNVGSLENKGVELSLEGKIISTKDVFWQIGYNISYNKNTITKLNYAEDPNYSVPAGSTIQGTIGDQAQAQKVGYPVNSFFVYQQVYDKNGNPIEGVYVDQNHDGQITSSDKYAYKKPAPNVLMGISSVVNYKNWDLALNGRVSLGNYVFNNIAELTTYQSFVGALSNHYITNVTKTAAENGFTTQQKFSDYWIENASFFRMDNISLGYTFPKFCKEKASLHLNLAVQNAFVISNYKGLDPEINGGMDNNFYPRPRTFVLGLNFTF